MSGENSTGDYEKDRKWSDQFLPRMREVIGAYLLKPSDFQTDATAATDLILLEAGNLDVACRIRRPGYIEKYGWQFTIRLERESGAMTEFEKIASGFADWFFYAHSAEDGSVTRWFLLNLDAFRAHLILYPGRLETGTGTNDDGTKFRWFDIRSFPASPPLVIASSVEIEPFQRPAALPLDPDLEKFLNFCQA